MPETLTRDEQIEQYVHREAVELFMQDFDEIDDERFFPFSVLAGEIGEVNLGAGRLGDELWPEEADYMTPEAMIARARSSAVLARLFARLASDEGRDYCARKAAWHAEWAAGRRDA